MHHQAPPQLPPQMFTTAAQLLDLTDSESYVSLCGCRVEDEGEEGGKKVGGEGRKVERRERRVEEGERRRKGQEGRGGMRERGRTKGARRES